MESSFPKPHIGMKKKWTCIGRDFGIVKYDSDTPSEYQEPPTGEWWGPSHPDFGTAVGKKHTVGMVEPLLGTSKTGGLGTFRKPVYKTGLTSVPKFYNWFHTDIRPINKAAKTPINIEVPIELEMVWTASGWEYDSKGQFFPLDKKGFNKGSSSTFHNYHFTVECWKRFIYEGGEKIVFSGDDDTWIYINNQLVIDLGGIHNAMSATYDVDAVAGLKKGDAYDLSLFHAERHAKDSSFKIVTNVVSSPIREVCSKVATTYPKDTSQSIKAMVTFPKDHAYMTRTTCSGNVYQSNGIPSMGPGFSAGCTTICSAELVYALNKLNDGSQSPIAKEKEMIIVTIIDEIGDYYFMLQGGTLPLSFNGNTMVIVDVGIDEGTIKSSSSSSPATSNVNLIKMFHSPGKGSTNMNDDYDTKKRKGEKQRLTMSWGSNGQTSGLIAGPFRTIGKCISIKIIENGLIETFSVVNMNLKTGELERIPLDLIQMKNGGVSICNHDCLDKCTENIDCETCRDDDQCGWSFNRGCFSLDTSGITGLSNKGTCVDPSTPAPRIGPNGQVGYGPADMFDTPSGSSSSKNGDGTLMGLDIGVVAFIFLILVCVGCCCLGVFYIWCCHSSSSSSSSSSKNKKDKEKKKILKPAIGIQMTTNTSGATTTLHSNPMRGGGRGGDGASHARTETQLPSGWGTDFDASGYKFYRNEVTGEVTWDAPAGSSGGTAALSAALAAAQASTGGGGGHTKQQSVMPPGWSSDYDISGAKFYVSDKGDVSWDKPLPVGWVEGWDENGHPYYTHTKTGKHQWDRPS